MTTIHNALSAVMAELPAIGKDEKAAPGQGGYSYRGIEAITRHVQGLFAAHGIVVVPSVRSVEVKDITVASKPWTDTTLHVDYLLVGPDGSTLQASTVGIGRDNSDKGANKAMTQAYKYLLLQLLCISDGKDDADGTTVEADTQAQRNPRVDRVLEELRSLDDTGKNAAREWADGRSFSAHALAEDEQWTTLVEAWLDERGTP